MKTPLFLIVLSAAVTLMLTACAATANASGSTAGTSWKLVSYGPTTGQTPAITGVDTSFTLNADGTLSGSLGCNSMGGEYTVSGQTMTFNNIYSTEMACDEPQMKQEGEAFAILQGTTTFKVDGDTLTITSTDGNNTLTFTKNK